MSDRGATASWDFALKGLDQGTGVQRDMKLWGQESFTVPLRKAYAEGKGKLPKERRLSDVVRRILRSMYAIGIDK
jgi:beta-glucosidase